MREFPVQHTRMENEEEEHDDEEDEDEERKTSSATSEKGDIKSRRIRFDLPDIA